MLYICIFYPVFTFAWAIMYIGLWLRRAKVRDCIVNYIPVHMFLNAIYIIALTKKRLFFCEMSSTNKLQIRTKVVDAHEYNPNKKKQKCAHISWDVLLQHCRHHDDVIKWEHFPRYWLFARGIHRSPMNSLHKGQWRGALMFPLICTRINAWVNNSEAGDLRRHRAHYDVVVMYCYERMLFVYDKNAWRAVTRSFDVFFDLHPTKRLSKQAWGWWF